MRGTGRLGNARYARLATIASGGMGKVYLGRAQIDGSVHTVAIKVLHPHLAREADMVAMFLDEARVSIKLHHPNVVHVWDVDLIGEELVIVMEYVEGATLAHLIRSARQRGEPLPIGVAARILCDGLTGLHAAHELVDDNSNHLGLVHRDVSPQNLLVGANGVTRVADFGVALSTGRLAQTQGENVKGKLRYLAPEQVLRRPLDRRLDVFSAGIVLWECLTGKRLFDGGTEAETLTQVMREPIPPPSLSRHDVTVPLDEVCLRALERDPDRRFATAAQFADALSTAVGQAVASAEAVGALVMRTAEESILEHRRTLEHAERSPRFADDPATAGVEIAPQAPRPGMRLAVVGVLCLLIGGTAMRVASRTTLAEDASAAAPPSSAGRVEPPPSAAVASAAASAVPSSPPTSSAPPPAREPAPARASAATARPARPVNPSVRKPPASKPGDSFMPGEL